MAQTLLLPTSTANANQPAESETNLHHLAPAPGELTMVPGQVNRLGSSGSSPKRTVTGPPTRGSIGFIVDGSRECPGTQQVQLRSSAHEVILSLIVALSQFSNDLTAE